MFSVIISYFQTAISSVGCVPGHVQCVNNEIKPRVYGKRKASCSYTHCQIIRVCRHSVYLYMLLKSKEENLSEMYVCFTELSLEPSFCIYIMFEIQFNKKGFYETFFRYKKSVVCFIMTSLCNARFDQYR